MLLPAGFPCLASERNFDFVCKGAGRPMHQAAFLERLTGLGLFVHRVQLKIHIKDLERSIYRGR